MTIKNVGKGKVRLYTRDGSRPLGPVTSRKKAIQQEIAIKISQEKQAQQKAILGGK